MRALRNVAVLLVASVVLGFTIGIVFTAASDEWDATIAYVSIVVAFLVGEWRGESHGWRG